jgi:hypothetical protein
VGETAAPSGVAVFLCFGLLAISRRIFELPSPGADASFPSMGGKALLGLALLASSGGARALAPIHDPVALNVGINCQWHRSCERRQFRALGDARQYIARAHPPLWRIHLCNRNAARSASRIDWVGFDNCIRNTRLKRPPRAR